MSKEIQKIITLRKKKLPIVIHTQSNNISQVHVAAIPLIKLPGRDIAPPAFMNLAAESPEKDLCDCPSAMERDTEAAPASHPPITEPVCTGAKHTP
jgi:hypothetical protein